MKTSLKHSLALLAFASALTASGPVLADSTQAMSTVSALGRLNGVALACQQMALSNRLREILIHSAPKERLIGEGFEQASNDAFLAQGNGQLPCPDVKTLLREIDGAEAALKKVFVKAP